MSKLDNVYIDDERNEINSKWKNIGLYSGSYIGDAIKEIQSYTESSDNMILHAILPMMSVVIGTKIKALSPAMEELRLNNWSIIIGNSGSSGKSTTIAKVEDLVLGKLEQELEDNYFNEFQAYKALSVEDKEKASEPKFVNLHSSEGGTYAGLLKDLSKNPHGQIAIYDEGSEFFTKMSKNQEAKASLTSIYEKKKARKSLVGNEGLGVNMIIKEPFLSFIIISNPDWFNEGIKKSDLTSGFLNRFAICHIKGEKLPTPFKNRTKPDFKQFQEVAVSIYNYLQNLDNTLLIEFSNDCFDSFGSWYKMIFESLANDSYSIEIKAFGMRQATASIKYAVLVKVFDAFYKGDKTINPTLTVEELTVGMNIAESCLYSIDSFLADRVPTEDDEPVDRMTVIAKKVHTYLESHDIYEENMLPTSALIRQVNGLNKANFAEIIEIVCKFDDVKSITKEISKGKDTTYYYYDPVYYDDEVTL